jgi:hypothetical protein
MLSSHLRLGLPSGLLPPVLRIPGVKRPGREVDHSPPSSADVKNPVGLHLHSPIHLHGGGTTVPFPIFQQGIIMLHNVGDPL